MSSPPGITKNTETSHHRSLLESVRRHLQKFQGHLGISTLPKRLMPPPSYRSVLLQKHLEGGSQIRSGTVSEFLVAFNSSLPPMSAEKLENGVEKHLAALFSHDLEWATQNPGVILDRVHRFLLHCVARDHDLDYLVPLSQADQQCFIRLATAYQWSLMHKSVYGWT